MKKKRIFWMLIALAALLIVLLSWQYRGGWLLPMWIRWEQTSIGEPVELSLRNRKVTAFSDGKVVWQSDENVRVQSVLREDIDHDSEAELLLLCWKRGRYGDSRPFWVEEDEQTWSQHIYIYDWEDGQITPIWMASDLGREVESWSFSEKTRLLLRERDGGETSWDWQTWGLSQVQPASLTFASVGDNLIHRQIYDYGFRHFEGNFDHLYADLQEELAKYDVISINQETVFVENRGDFSDYPRFGTPIQVGNAVINAGFDIVSCATNHMLDQGAAAIDRTAALFEEAGVLCPGIQKTDDPAYRPYEILEQNGIRCAVFSYTQTTNGLPVPEETPHILHTLDDEAQVRQELLQGREEADLCLVYVHWGTEYAAEPDETQKYWAQVFADCGADVVIGTHPHVLQPVELIKGAHGRETVVYYSLGNFISAQTEEACTVGGLAWYTAVKANGSCRIADYGLKTLKTENENGRYRTVLYAP